MNRMRIEVVNPRYITDSAVRALRQYFGADAVWIDFDPAEPTCFEPVHDAEGFYAVDA
jgi:hypothetical protein